MKVENGGKITFVGAGPGAPDLITLRGLACIREADVIIYAGSLVNEKLLENAPGAALHNSAKMALEEVMELMLREFRAGKKVVRLHTGDPAVYGAVSEQYRELDKAGIPYEVVPGVSSVFAAAAALKAELTMPDLSQSVIMTRAPGRTPVPPGEALEELAKHGSTLCIFLSVGDMENLCAKLVAAGRPPETPAAVVYRASWENQQIVRGTLADIAAKVTVAGIKRQAMIVVGEVLTRGGELSKLYDRHFTTGFRHHRFSGNVAVFALTRQAVLKASEIASGLAEARLFVPEKFAGSAPELRRSCFPEGGFGRCFAENWSEFDAFVMVMAAGIVVRRLSGLCADKKKDPAVVVCDEQGNYAVSLLSGHAGGGNDLARDVAAVTGGRAVITTASDVEQLPAFDEFARRHRAEILTPEALTAVASDVVNREPIGLEMPRRLFDAEFAGRPQFTLLRERTDGRMRACSPRGTLELSLPFIVLGIGCRKGVSSSRIGAVVKRVLEELQLDMADVSLIGSASVKQEEPGLLDFARGNGLECRFFAAEELNRVPVPNPSAAAMRELGINSVSEASALLGAGEGAVLIRTKLADTDVTVAAAERRSCR